MLGALDVHRALLARDVGHEIVRLTRAVTDADDLPAALGLPSETCLAVRLYALSGGATPYVAVAVPAGEVPDPTLLLDATGARAVRPAGAAEVNAVTDSAHGLVPPVALPDALPLLVDARLGATTVLYAPTGEGWTALGIATRDLLLHTGARVATLTRAVSELDLLSDLDLEATGVPAPAAALPDVPAVRSAGVRPPTLR